MEAGAQRGRRLGAAVDYADAPGAFVGDDAAARCRKSPAINALFAKHNDASARVLSVAIAAGPTPFTGPVDLFSCEFQSDGTTPASDDFVITIGDASDPRYEQIQPRPTVVPSEIHEIVP